MTIKIKAPVIWLDPSFPIYRGRLNEDERKYRLVADTDWRKLMRLVKAADEHDHADPSKVCDICEALAALQEKKK